MGSQQTNSERDAWPALPYTSWEGTCQALHLWCQVVGKIRLALTPWVNHSWHATLYPTIRGLTTSPIPYEERIFEIDFDFIDHLLLIRTNDGKERALPLQAQSVAAFYAKTMATLGELGIRLPIHETPSEIPDAVPFSQDELKRPYDPESAHRFWRVLLQIDQVFKRFRTGFLGKVSPVHLFWGAFDLAVTRFSGRTAPLHPGGMPNLPDSVTREAYSHEVSSAGFWPGGGPIDYPAFYCYAYPAPEDFRSSPVAPEATFYHETLGEFILPYEAMRTAEDPKQALLTFLQTTY